MNNQRLISALLTIGVFLAAGFQPAAADDMALRMCVNCHGQDGRGGDANTPIIAGVADIVQEDALYAYIDGDRQCPSAPIMCKMANGLSEDQVTSLAAHFSALPWAPAGEDFDAVLAEKGKAIHASGCAICHGADEPGDPNSSIVHGQRKGYLRTALQQYAAGERKQLPAMEKKTTELSADDIEALVHFYASYRE